MASFVNRNEIHAKIIFKLNNASTKLVKKKKKFLGYSWLNPAKIIILLQKTTHSNLHKQTKNLQQKELFLFVFNSSLYLFDPYVATLDQNQVIAIRS